MRCSIDTEIRSWNFLHNYLWMLGAPNEGIPTVVYREIPLIGVLREGPLGISQELPERSRRGGGVHGNFPGIP